MNPRSYKTPACRCVHVDRLGRTFSLSVVPQMVIDTAEQAARDRWDSAGETPNDGNMNLETYIQVIGAVNKDGWSADLIREQLVVGEIIYLYTQWVKVQMEDLPDSDELKRVIMSRIPHDTAIKSDGARATFADSATEFYGKSVCELTDGQLAYFNALNEAWGELYSSAPGKTKYVSKKWLGTLEN